MEFLVLFIFYFSALAEICLKTMIICDTEDMKLFFFLQSYILREM